MDISNSIPQYYNGRRNVDKNILVFSMLNNSSQYSSPLINGTNYQVPSGYELVLVGYRLNGGTVGTWSIYQTDTSVSNSASNGTNPVFKIQCDIFAGVNDFDLPDLVIEAGKYITFGGSSGTQRGSLYGYLRAV